jgi:hypothetical protein
LRFFYADILAREIGIIVPLSEEGSAVMHTTVAFEAGGGDSSRLSARRPQPLLLGLGSRRVTPA